MRFAERFTGKVQVNQSVELQGSVPITFSDCGGADFLGKVKSMAPNALQTGKTTQIVASGSLAKRVRGGTYNIQVKQTLFPYKTLGVLKDAPICEERELQLSAVGVKVGKLTWEGLSCPLSAGKIVAKIDMELSGKLPAGLASTKTSVTANGPRGEKLLCVTIESKR